MGGDVFVPSALIASAGNNANEYLAKHVAELGYLRPTIVASGGEARRRMGDIDFEVVIINTPLPDEFGHELSTYAVENQTPVSFCLPRRAPQTRFPINCSSTVCWC